MNDAPDPTCAVESCSRPVGVLWAGLCLAHYQRLWESGDVRAGEPLRAPSDAKRVWPTSTGLTYHGATTRVRRTRGPASAHPCASCGAPATQWRLTDPNNAPRVTGHPKTQGGPRAGLPYSPNPADYQALCLRCISSSEQPSLFELGEATDRGPPHAAGIHESTPRNPIAGKASNHKRRDLQ